MMTSSASRPDESSGNRARRCRPGRRSHRTAAVAIAAGLLATGCGGSDEAQPAQAAQPSVTSPATSGIRLVQPADVARLLGDGVTVIDVRTPEEFAAGHIDGATIVDFYEPDFAERLAALDPAGEYLVYCRSGNRSGQAVALMEQLGFTDVADLDGGVVAYQAAGLGLVP